MKQATITLLALLFVCVGITSQAQETQKDETTQGKKMKMKQKEDKMKMKGDMSMASVELPYTASYSSQFQMGNPAHSKMILDLHRAYEANDFSMTDRFSDTVTVQFPDGQIVKGRDAVMNAFKQGRASLSNTKFNISAVIPVHSVDRNSDWVCLWGSQQSTAANNNTPMTTEFQSIWNINKDGKIDYVQFFEGKPAMQQ